MDILIQRQIERTTAGNDAYLATLLRCARQAGYRIRVVMAPLRSFGNRPWSHIHPQFAELIDEVVWPRSLALGRYRLSLSPTVWWRFGKRLVKAVQRWVGHDVLIFSHFASPLEDAEAAIVADRCNERPADVTIAEYSALAPLLARLTQPTRKGVLMHDLLSVRAEEFRRMGLPIDFLEFGIAEEADWVSHADFCLYASKDEQSVFSRFVPETDALWLKPAVPAPSDVVASDDAPKLVYLGTQHAGNVDALDHLLTRIWPKVRAAVPHAELLVVGSIGEELATSSEAGVRVLGRVANLATVGGAQRIGLAPTRLATGVSIKVAEYLMLGMPVVAYRKALQGFGDELDDLVRVADDEATFLAHCVDLLSSEGCRRSLSCRATAEAGERLGNAEVVRYLNEVPA